MGFGAMHLAGFGPVAAAARTAALIERLTPQRVLLIGIAGAYDTSRHPVGSALVFDRVALHGVGAGEGADFLGPPALGFPQWPAQGETQAIEDELPLAVPHGIDRVGRAPLLLTTTAASATAEQANECLRRFPAAAAEDMEGFAVAFACALAHIPLAIARGISNPVGERNPARWNIPLALAAALRAARGALEQPHWEPPRP